MAQRHHYVPIWYQKRFLGEAESKLSVGDIQLMDNSSIPITRREKVAVRKWYPKSSFCEDGLYRTKFEAFESDEIEEMLFGRLDTRGALAVAFWSAMTWEDVREDAFDALLRFMDAQRLRTPRGLDWLRLRARAKIDKNTLLMLMQKVRQVHCTMWTECVWSIVRCSSTQTKFIFSDNPVTLYNGKCAPLSKHCRYPNDPWISLAGTHTLFPLDPEACLVLTNLSYCRNPYQSALTQRPNPRTFGDTIFNFLEVQHGRQLTELEVNQFNYVIKKRAHRLVASSNREWLFPERTIGMPPWSSFDANWLFMPDPREIKFHTETLVRFNDGSVLGQDEYGRPPGSVDATVELQRNRESQAFRRFQEEFGTRFPKGTRGLSGDTLWFNSRRTSNS